MQWVWGRRETTATDLVVDGDGARCSTRKMIRLSFFAKWKEWSQRPCNHSVERARSLDRLQHTATMSPNANNARLAWRWTVTFVYNGLGHISIGRGLCMAQGRRSFFWSAKAVSERNIYELQRVWSSSPPSVAPPFRSLTMPIQYSRRENYIKTIVLTVGQRKCAIVFIWIHSISKYPHNFVAVLPFGCFVGDAVRCGRCWFSHWKWKILWLYFIWIYDKKMLVQNGFVYNLHIFVVVLAARCFHFQMDFV